MDVTLLASFIALIISALSAPWATPAPVAAHPVTFVGGHHVDTPTYTYWPGDARTVVFVHGGGWVGGARTELPGWMVGFQQDGWTVATVDYTLGDVDQAVADVVAAVGQVRSDLEPSTVVLAGWSAGAHLALAATARGLEVDALVLASTPFTPDVVAPVRCLQGHAPLYLIYGVADAVTPWVDNRLAVRECGLLGPTTVALVPGEHDPSADVNNASILDFANDYPEVAQ